MAHPFPETQWSALLRASTGDAPALEALCRDYWPPLYGYLRRRGLSQEDAQDALQSFLMSFIERKGFGSASKAEGRFRSYLLGALKNHLSHRRDRRNAQKRGGGVAPLSLDWEAAEGRYRREPSDGRTAEDVYVRQWALTLMERAADQVRRDYVARGQRALFAALGGQLIGETVPPHSEIASSLGMKVGAVKVASHRMRRRFRDALEREVALTVDDVQQVDAELRALQEAVAA